MIRLILCYRKQENVSTEDFQLFWKRKHANAARDLCERLEAISYTAALTLNIERNKTMSSRFGTVEPYDATMEVFWDNAAHVDRILGNPEFVGLFGSYMVEQMKYIDIRNSCAFYTESPLDLSIQNTLARPILDEDD